MRVRIHRGSKEIGGNCIELESAGKHILFDLGMPLTAANPDEVKLPEVSGLSNGDDPNFLGVIISHPHQDHYGLLPKAHSTTPVFIGKEAHAILEASAPFSPSGLHLDHVIHYRDKTPFEVGPFRFTPFLNDHSAFDAYALSVEADGKVLFYTGDFRAHGRKSGAFNRLLARGPKKVDVLLMEGTNIGRGASEKKLSTESQLEDEIQASLARTEGLALAWFSGQNIDRFVTFYKAAKGVGRIFVADLYVAHILNALDRRSLPNPRASDIRIFLPARMRSKIIRDKSFDLVRPYYDRRIYPEEIRDEASNLVMTFRPVMCRDLEKARCLKEARLIYSLWPGYLERGNQDIREWCKGHGVHFEIQHTSGHAGISDMKKLVNALSPKRIVPIHSFNPKRFSEFFPNVEPTDDGVWWSV